MSSASVSRCAPTCAARTSRKRWVWSHSRSKARAPRSTAASPGCAPPASPSSRSRRTSSSSDAQIDRYSRQIILPQIGAQGQQRLLQSAVAVGGDGALAEVVALYLAGAGVGRIALQGIDREALRAAIMDLNPDVEVRFGELGGADLPLLCNGTLAQIDRAAASRRPVIAGGDGW